MRYTWLIPAVLAVGLSGCRREQQGGRSGSPAEKDIPETCRRDPVDNPNMLEIAVIPKGTTHEFWKAIHAGAIKAQLELGGVLVRWDGPLKEGDREYQINLIETSINKGVAGIAVAPLDDKALVRPIRAATREGISVVIMDSGLNAEVCTDFASFVATDNYIGGQRGGKRLGELLGGKGKVLMLRYQVGSASTAKREQGFLDVMAEDFPAIEIVSSDQYGQDTSGKAQDAAMGLLGKYQDLDGIFTPNESTTFGMLRALQTLNRAGKVKFVGFDSSPKLIEAMEEGEIQGLVLQDPLNMGYLAVKTLVSYLRGEEVKTRIDTGSALATPENMNDPRMRELLSPPIEKYLR